jgi:hypothetical protein
LRKGGKMAEQLMIEKTRARKPKARPTEIVIGAIDERLQMINDSPHASRLSELMDELRRSLNSNRETEEAV